MIFSCGENWLAKRGRLQKWHKWFAYLPVKIGVDENGKDVCVWLQTIGRKGTHDSSYFREKAWTWEYRLEKDDE